MKPAWYEEFEEWWSLRSGFSDGEWGGHKNVVKAIAQTAYLAGRKDEEHDKVD